MSCFKIDKFCCYKINNKETKEIDKTVKSDYSFEEVYWITNTTLSVTETLIEQSYEMFKPTTEKNKHWNVENTRMWVLNNWNNQIQTS